jgi:hypothetical protein
MGVCSFSLDGPSLLLFIGSGSRGLEKKFGISLVFGSIPLFIQLRRVSGDRFFDPSDLNAPFPTPA